MPRVATNSKIVEVVATLVALFLSLTIATNARADSFDTSTWYMPGSFIQTITAARHVMDERFSMADDLERKRALVNEYDEPKVVKRPTNVAWTLGYTFAQYQNPFGSELELDPEYDHTFHVGLIWEFMRDMDATLIFRIDSVPFESYRGGMIEMTFGNFEFLRPKPLTKTEQDELEDENLSPFARIARKQQRRDEDERRRKNERETERPQPRVFLQESLFMRMMLGWSRHQLNPPGQYRDAWGFHLGPQLFYLPEPTTSYRFSILWSNYNVPVGNDLYVNLQRPGPRAALAKTNTGYADLGLFARGFPNFVFAGGLTWNFTGPWLLDLGGNLCFYSTNFVSTAGTLSLYREIIPDLTLGFGGDLVVSEATLGLLSVRLSYDL